MLLEVTVLTTLSIHVISLCLHVLNIIFMISVLFHCFLAEFHGRSVFCLFIYLVILINVVILCFTFIANFSFCHIFISVHRSQIYVCLILL